MSKVDIKSMYPDELKEFIVGLGEPSFRAGQIFKWLHSGCTSFDDMSNISKSLRNKLSEVSYIANVEIVEKFVSKLDETVKYLYKLNDGDFLIS